MSSLTNCDQKRKRSIRGHWTTPMCIPKPYKRSVLSVVIETYEDDSFLNNLTYTLITVIPIAILLVMIWVCCRMRNCSFYPLNTRRSLVERELRRRERECEMRRREMRESLSGEWLKALDKQLLQIIVNTKTNLVMSNGELWETAPSEVT